MRCPSLRHGLVKIAVSWKINRKILTTKNGETFTLGTQSLYVGSIQVLKVVVIYAMFSDLIWLRKTAIVSILLLL